VLPERDGPERYRPTFLSLMLANQVLFGDMVEVVKSGVDATWPSTIDYDGDTIQTDVPYIHAFATSDNGERGLILLNLHRTDALPVQIDLPADVQDTTATRWQMTANTITANNERGHDAEVTTSQRSITDFTSGYQTNLPPHSMTVFRWSE
jgi:alpha-L-arabinofuranosidase